MSDYLDRELDAGERARLERHTSVCPKCRAVLEALRRLTAALARLPITEGAGHGSALAVAVRGRLDDPPADASA
jgi:anti-sigma factor RsiW